MALRSNFLLLTLIPVYSFFNLCLTGYLSTEAIDEIRETALIETHQNPAAETQPQILSMHDEAQNLSRQTQPRNQVNEEDKFRIARIKYRGGGDWYNDPSALSNLIDFAVNHIPISIQRSYDDVSIGSRDLHHYPFVFMTGHGNIDVNATEAANMREYLDNGGFLYIDDDYGFDPYVRPVIEKIFPDEELIELPASHPIYSMVFDFPDGLPKIHDHDGKPPQGFGIFRNGKLVLYYTYESNLADGWAFDVHDNPEHIVDKSLRMGVNLLVYAFTSEN